MSKSQHWLAMALVVLLSGGHVAVVQVTAWSSMIVTRTTTMGWQTAVESTFDGSAPCALCHAADDLQQDFIATAERDRSEPLPAVKTILPDNNPPPPPGSQAWGQVPAVAQHSLLAWHCRPEPPPPRS